MKGKPYDTLFQKHMPLEIKYTFKKNNVHDALGTRTEGESES